MASFIELLEQPDPHVPPRRLYVNLDAIAYVSAYSEASPAVLTLCCPGMPAMPVAETWQHVQAAIDAAQAAQNGEAT